MFPLATGSPGSVLRRVVKLVTLQPALVCPPPSTDAEVHLTLTADAGTVTQPLKLGEVVPALKVHIFPLLPWVIFQATVATVLPAMVLPGLFAVNGTVLGVALNMLTLQNLVVGTDWLADGITGVGWRELPVDF